VTPDPPPPPRVKDPELMEALHREWLECALVMTDAPRCIGGLIDGRSLHHIHRHPRDDVRANLVMLCGDGVRGCHGAITENEPETCRLLGRHIREQRPDTFAYLTQKLRGSIQADEWLRRYLA
jgi:hypothetical protein